MKYFLHLTCVLLVDLLITAAETNKENENTKDSLEEMQKCMTAAKVLQSDPKNEKKMKVFYNDCDKFLKKLILTNNQKRVLEKLGYKSKQLPISLRNEYETKDKSSEKDELGDLMPNDKDTATKFTASNEVNLPPREASQDTPSTNQQSQSLMGIQKAGSIEMSLPKSAEKPSIFQAATADNLHLGFQQSEGFARAADQLRLHVQNRLREDGFTVTTQGVRQENLGPPDEIRVPPPTLQRNTEQPILSLQQQKFQQETVRHQSGLPQGKPIHGLETAAREAAQAQIAFQRQQANLRTAQDPSRFRANTGNQFAQFPAPQVQQRPVVPPQAGMHQNLRAPQRQGGPQPLRTVQYPPNAQRMAPRRNNFVRFPNRFDEL